MDPVIAAAALVVYAHRHEVVHLLYAAADETDAVRRIAGLLQFDEATVIGVLDQPLRWLLPGFRRELEDLAARPAAQTAAGVALLLDGEGGPSGDQADNAVAVRVAANGRRRTGD